MQGKQLRTIRRGLPGRYRRQVPFGVLVGRSDTMLSRYENGHDPIPDSVAAFATVAAGLRARLSTEALENVLDAAHGAAMEARTAGARETVARGAGKS